MKLQLLSLKTDFNRNGSPWQLAQDVYDYLTKEQGMDEITNVEYDVMLRDKPLSFVKALFEPGSISV